MILNKAVGHLSGSSPSGGGVDWNQQEFPTNADFFGGLEQQQQQQQRAASSTIVMGAINKKRALSPYQDSCNAQLQALGSASQGTKKRARTLCPNTSHNNNYSQISTTPIASNDCHVDELSECPQASNKSQFSLKYFGMSAKAEQVYEWQCHEHNAKVLICIVPHQGSIRLQRLQGEFQSTRFIQVIENGHLKWVHFGASLVHIAECLREAMKEGIDVENYLVPGRFRLGYEEVSSMLIS